YLHTTQTNPLAGATLQANRNYLRRGGFDGVSCSAILVSAPALPCCPSSSWHCRSQAAPPPRSPRRLPLPPASKKSSTSCSSCRRIAASTTISEPIPAPKAHLPASVSPTRPAVLASPPP